MAPRIGEETHKIILFMSSNLNKAMVMLHFLDISLLVKVEATNVCTLKWGSPYELTLLKGWKFEYSTKDTLIVQNAWQSLLMWYGVPCRLNLTFDILFLFHIFDRAVITWTSATFAHNKIEFVSNSLHPKQRRRGLVVLHFIFLYSLFILFESNLEVTLAG